MFTKLCNRLGTYEVIETLKSYKAKKIMFTKLCNRLGTYEVVEIMQNLTGLRG